MGIKRYSSKEPLVFIWVMVPYIVFLNLLLMGTCIFSSVPNFLKTFLLSTVYFSLVYGVFGYVAVLVKNKNPGAGDLFKRVRLMLPIFYLMNIGAVLGAVAVYRLIRWHNCEVQTDMIWGTIIYCCVMSTLITFINEGMANWEKWKSSLSESEKLKNAYDRSKLLGLKGQINPHFLFNCFNTLSGLIQENEEEAERFLDEMTKVHRYLLRGDDEYLVPLRDEMKFANSYLYLTKARFGQAVQVSINLPEHLMDRRLPPLSMQVILENIIYTNALSKKEPLQIEITSDNEHLIIKHSVHEKVIVQHLNLDEGLDNLIYKYRLLHKEEMNVVEAAQQRQIIMPLFEPNFSIA